MNKVRATHERLDGLVPYDPKYLPAKHLMSANENPRNIPDDIRLLVRNLMKRCHYNRYPDPLANELRDEIAEVNGLDRGNIILGNGGDELLLNTAIAWGGSGRSFLDMPPTFSVYQQNARLTGTCIVEIPRRADYSVDADAVLERVSQGDIDFLIIASPNNPTGQLVDPGFILELLDATDALVLVDEAYGEFSRTTLRPYLNQHKNLAILRTFSKAFAMAGIRLGYILASEEVITEYVKVRQPYSVDVFSQMAGLEVYRHRSEFSPEINEIIDERAYVYKRLSEMPGVTPYPSDANFILFKVDRAHEVWEQLYERGVLIRDFSSTPRLEDCLRVSIGTPEQNEAFCAALTEILEMRGRS